MASNFLCSIGLHGSKKWITSVGGGATYQGLWRCKRCGTYLFRGGFNGDVNSTFMDKADKEALKRYMPKNATPEKIRKIRKHVDRAFDQPHKFVDSLF